MRPTVSVPQFTPASVELGLREIGIDMKIGPSEAVCRCCFNTHKKPSLYVNIDNKPGVWHCFGCEQRGSFETLVQAFTGWSHTKSVMTCRAWARAVANDPPRPKPPPIPKLPQEARLAPLRWRHPYIYSRGVIEETAQRFGVGYDKATNMITFPWFAGNGTLVAIKSRSPNSKYYKFDDGSDPNSTLYGLQFVKQHSFVWPVEGEFDAMFLDQCFRLGHFTRHHAVALGGKYMHNRQIDVLCRREPHRVVLMLDNDDAGREAQAEITKRLLARVRVMAAPYPPDTHDPNKLTFEQVIILARFIEQEAA